MRKTILIFFPLLLTIVSCKLTSDKKRKSENAAGTSVLSLINDTIYGKKSFLAVFYNTENLFDTIDDPDINDDEFTPNGLRKWTGERYRDKIIKIARVLTSIENRYPTLIGLCEVENKSVLKDLINSEQFKKKNFGIIHEDSPDKRGIDVALLYDKSKFTYVSHETLSTKLADYKVRDILYVKGCFSSKDTFHIFVNHWKSRRGGKNKTEHMRIASAMVLQHKLNQIFKNDKSANIVIMGDFNDEPADKSLKETLSASNVNSAKDNLYNLMYSKYLEGEGSFSRNYKWNMLDNIIVSKSVLDGKTYSVKSRTGFIYKPDEILYYNAKANMKVPNKTFGGKNYYGGYSDHLPVYFILERK